MKDNCKLGKLQTSFLRSVGLVAVLLVGMTHGAAEAACVASATEVRMTHEAGGAGGVYVAGGTVLVTVSLCYSGSTPVDQLGVSEFLPEGWTFVAMAGGNVPPIVPSAGDTGQLDFAYVLPPSFPTSFQFRVRAPLSATGDQNISGHVIYGLGGPQMVGPMVTITLAQSDSGEGEGENEGAEEPVDNDARCADSADKVVLIREVPGNLYEPGASVEVTITFCYNGTDKVNSLGLEETLPAGWAFGGFTGGAIPPISPQPGSSGTLAFAYIFPPSFPATFKYLATVPADLAGELVISGSGIYAFSGSQQRTNTEATVVVDGVLPVLDIHSADQDADHQISLSEMLRVIQMYNSLGYHCAAGTEDGYAPGAGDTSSCAPHLSDYSPQDWSISLSEMLRIVQFFNSFGYIYCPDADTEDGFCPGQGN